MSKFGIVALVLCTLLAYQVGFKRGAVSSSENLARLQERLLHKESDVAAAQTADRASAFFKTSVTEKKLPAANDVFAAGSRQRSDSIEKTASLISARLNAVPESVIKSYLTKYLGPELNAKVQKPREFAENLLAVVLSDDENPVTGTLRSYASLSPAIGLRPIDAIVNLDQFASVYAHFSTEDTDDIGLLLKWKNLSSGETISLDKVVVSAQSASYRAFKPDQGWENGVYQLLAYNLYGPNDLLSAVQFRVDAVYPQDSQEALQINYDAINEMISVGQAVEKNHSQ